MKKKNLSSNRRNTSKMCWCGPHGSAIHTHSQSLNTYDFKATLRGRSRDSWLNPGRKLKEAGSLSQPGLGRTQGGAFVLKYYPPFLQLHPWHPAENPAEVERWGCPEILLRNTLFTLILKGWRDPGIQRRMWVKERQIPGEPTMLLFYTKSSSGFPCSQ
jgi:hypothetical protein